MLALPEYLYWRRHHISLAPCACRGWSSSHSVTARVVVWRALLLCWSSLVGQGRLLPLTGKICGGSCTYRGGSLSPRYSLRKCLSVQDGYFCVSLCIPPRCCLSVGNVLPFPSRWTWLPLWVGSESCILLAALLSLTGCPGAWISLGKSEMAARQVFCWFPCSSFLLLAEQNLIFFLTIIMGCEEQLLN